VFIVQQLNISVVENLLIICLHDTSMASDDVKSIYGIVTTNTHQFIGSDYLEGCCLQQCKETNDSNYGK